MGGSRIGWVDQADRDRAKRHLLAMRDQLEIAAVAPPLVDEVEELRAELDYVRFRHSVELAAVGEVTAEKDRLIEDLRQQVETLRQQLDAAKDGPSS